MGRKGIFPSLRVFVPVTLLDWALYCVKNVCPVVGVSSNEDQTMAHIF
jgi:hypothetical protein